MPNKPVIDVDAWLDSQSDAPGCWEWPGQTASGYGRGTVDKRIVTVHRYAYETRVAPLPDGVFACHSCDNRRCARPSHIFPGTQKDNIADMLKKGRGRNPLMEANRAKTHCAHGHEFTPENTFLDHSRAPNGERACIECRRRRGRAFMEKRRRLHGDDVRKKKREWARQKRERLSHQPAPVLNSALD